MMNKPPEFVRMTLECCGLLLKNWVDREITWKMAQKMTHHTHFITTIVHFDPFRFVCQPCALKECYAHHISMASRVPQEVKEKMRKSYFSNPDFNYDKVPTMKSSDEKQPSGCGCFPRAGL